MEEGLGVVGVGAREEVVRPSGDEVVKRPKHACGTPGEHQRHAVVKASLNLSTVCVVLNVKAPESNGGTSEMEQWHCFCDTVTMCACFSSTLTVTKVDSATLPLCRYASAEKHTIHCTLYTRCTVYTTHIVYCVHSILLVDSGKALAVSADGTAIVRPCRCVTK